MRPREAKTFEIEVDGINNNCELEIEGSANEKDRALTPTGKPRRLIQLLSLHDGISVPFRVLKPTSNTRTPYPTFNLLKHLFALKFMCNMASSNPLDIVMECPPLSAHFSPFLCLPLHIRHQIYVDAGVLRRHNSKLYFNQDLVIVGRSRSDFLRVSHSLLLTCRTTYTEISDIMYSRNEFIIRYKDAHSLKALRDLTPHSIARLTQLTVHLNVTSCHNGACWKVATDREDNKPLESLWQTILSEWQVTASYIAAYVRPAHLSLYFICDVNDLETATRALKPLSSFPPLVDCSIRLARQPNPVLQDMAQEMAIRAMGYQHRSNCMFPFLSLPRELRLQILQFTNLVSPLREIEWSPESKFHLHYINARCSGPFHGEYPLDCPLDVHRACQFRDCSQYAGCFCREYHASFSSKCKCWSPPTPLFLVCKQLQEDAQTVFFSKNRFIIRPSGKGIFPVKSTPARLEISIFLADIVPSHALQFLSFLEIVFPPFYDDYLGFHEPAYQDWLKTIDYASKLLDLPKLILRVHMADYIYHWDPAPDFRNKITKEGGTKIVQMYIRALRPLSKLRANGLMQFSAFAAYPWAHTLSCLRNPDRTFQHEKEFNKQTERYVMGNDYNGISVHPKRLGPSQWSIEQHMDPFV